MLKTLGTLSTYQLVNCHAVVQSCGRAVKEFDNLRLTAESWTFNFQSSNSTK